MRLQAERVAATIVTMQRNAAALAGIAALVALVAATGFVRQAAEEARPPAVELAIDVPPFPPAVARPFSFGLRSLVADLTFLEAIQVFGARKSNITLAEGLHEDRLLAKLLTYSTDLDPKFRGAYRFAGDALPRHTTDGMEGGIFAAETLLKRGAVERADDWQIHFLLGFIESYYLEKREEAAVQFAAAARLEGAPAYLAMLATRVAAHAGDLAFAGQLAQTMLAQSSEESTRAEWQNRLLDIAMERGARDLDAAVVRFRAQTGRLPERLDALVSSGIIPAIPAEPHGGSYFIDALGAVHSTHGERLQIRNKAQNQAGVIPQ